MLPPMFSSLAWNVIVKIDDVHLVDSIVDRTHLSSIFTTIKVLTIHVECVVTKLPQLSFFVILSLFSNFVLDPLILSLLVFLSLNICSFVIINLSVDWKALVINFKTVSIWKYLHFHHYFGEINMFKIFDSHLTYLNISWLRVDEKFNVDYVIELVTPKLEYFKYCNSNLYYFSNKINLSLVEKIDSQFFLQFNGQQLYFQILS